MKKFVKQKNSKLWFYFVAIIFTIMFSTALILSLLTLYLFHRGYFPTPDGPVLPAIIFLLFLSVVLSTSVFIFVANKILQPITSFTLAYDEIARGNFDIKVEEKSHIKEIRHMAKSFNFMARELSSIETLRNDFVVNVSHEFKTPIAAIEGYATLLQDKSLSEIEREECTKMIIDSARQLSTLSGNILRLSKLENQEMIMEKSIYRLDEQIRQAVLLLESEWSAKSHDLIIELNETNYYGNESLLLQVWLNLIGNAIKFTPNEGRITIQLTSDEENIKVKITDTGIGMEESVIRHIFDKFYQGDTARKVGGNGLGLALTKRIVDLIGGGVEVRSRVGEGSELLVILENSS